MALMKGGKKKRIGEKERAYVKEVLTKKRVERVRRMFDML